MSHSKRDNQIVAVQRTAWSLALLSAALWIVPRAVIAQKAPKPKTDDVVEVTVEGEGQENDPEGQHETHRPLGEHGQRRSPPEQETGPATVHVAGSPDREGPQCDPDQAAQQRIDLRPPGLCPGLSVRPRDRH